jgi:hypothetical protein
MRFLPVLTVLAAMAFPGASAWAEPATAEGARSLEEAYAAYFSRAVIDRAIVTIAPDNDEYIVTWALQKVADLSGLHNGIKIDNLSYQVVPGQAGAWTVRGVTFPRVTFDLPTPNGRTTGALDFHGVRADARSDPSQSEFLRSTLGIESMEGAFKRIEGEQISDAKIAGEVIVFETSAKPANDDEGVNLAIAEASRSVRETASAPPKGEHGDAAQMNYGVSGTVGVATFSGLRARELGEVWKSAIAHIAGDVPPLEVKSRLISALPLWSELRSHAQISDVSVETAEGAAALKTLAESFKLTGFAAEGAAEISVDIDELNVKSDFLPPWNGELWPASLTLNLSASIQGWDKVARIAIDDPGFLERGELSSGAMDKIVRVLTSGHPKLVLAPGHLKTPTLDLTFEGVGTNEPGPGAAVHLKISADGLDKTLDLLREISKTEPNFGGVIFGVTLLKGLAKTDANGRLVWEIGATLFGDITINGTPLTSLE